MFGLVLVGLVASSNSSPQITPKDLKACIGVQVIAADMQALSKARAASPPEAWRDACRQARDAELRRGSLRRALIATGASPLGGFDGATALLVQARHTQDPVVRELLERAFRADFPRESFGSVEKASYAAGLSPMAERLLDGLRSIEAVKADTNNTAWLSATVARQGWFDRRRYGEDADAAAWLITQHSDASPSTQKALIDILEPVALSGGSSMLRFASLYDRWAAGAGQMARYGLNGRCTGPGRWNRSR